jgi:iron(III) transport system substrate-binding protein
MNPCRRDLLKAVLGLGLATAGCGRSPEDTGGLVESGAQPLTIYSTRDKDAVAHVVGEFVRKFPQYRERVNIVTLSAQDAITRLRAEQANPQAGFLWGGTLQGLQQAARENLLAPSAPEIAGRIDPSRKDPEGRWYAEILLPEVIVYNHERLSPQRAPRDWDDLVTPRFSGQILIRDVMASGTMRTIFSAMVYRHYARTGSADAGYQWLRRLDANTINYAANPDDMYFKLDRGVGTVTLWNLQDVLIQSKKHRRPWSYVMPTSGAPVLLDGVGVVNNPKSRRAAHDFQNFLFSPEIQLALARDYFQIPATPLAGGGRPDWLDSLAINEMPIDWTVMTDRQAEWMDYWSRHIQGTGRRS